MAFLKGYRTVLPPPSACMDKETQALRAVLNLTVTVDLAGAIRAHSAVAVREFLENFRNSFLEIERQVQDDPCLQEFVAVHHSGEVDKG
ncbi:MAG: hypothetical protein ACYDHF_06280 [Candidatus Cryosericum sp.]